MLNELDHWIESQWENHPVITKYQAQQNQTGSPVKSNGYRAMRGTKLKEMYIVRYADDFRIFCRTKTDAEKTLVAVTQWLQKRLRLQVSPEKTRVVNVRRKYSDFLGFKIKVHKKSEKYVVKSHIADKSLKRLRQELTNQAKNVANPRTTEIKEINLYNSIVTGIQNYYCIATDVNLDCSALNRAAMTIFTNRLRNQRGTRLVRKGRKLTKYEKSRYGKSAMLRYIAGSDEPVYPIGYVQHKKPMAKKRTVNPYSTEGRYGIHDNLRVNMAIMRLMMKQPLYDRSAEYSDNRISLFSAQWGKCAVTGKDFMTLDSIHCHHIVPKRRGGTDRYHNLVLMLPPVHKLIHATKKNTINYYLIILNLNEKQLEKLNEYREKVGNAKI